MANFLEQLVAEWYEYQGYFILRNVRVGKLRGGGYEAELDVVAFRPAPRHIVHIETSTDADRWEKRIEKLKKKFTRGRQYIPDLLKGFDVKEDEIEQDGIFVFGAKKNHDQLGAAKIKMLSEFMEPIREILRGRSYYGEIVPEQFVILRGLQFAAHFWK
ncbi:MAG: hypothetical protein KGQ79_00845 [Proteobacteria bacterium]|nr:hypothetical protein [Pseudomonadota bacterium]